MSSSDAAPDPRAVAALVAATGVEGPDGVDEALLAGIEALGGEAGAVQAVVERGSRFGVAAEVGLPPDAAADLGGSLTSGLAGRVLASGGEVTVAPGDDLLPGALGAAGLLHAVALPARSRDRLLGVLWVAGREALAQDPLRMHAARVAAGRAAWNLERARLSDNLERAMAQILQTDERMLGRIGLDIHDGPTQQLTVALLEVQLLEADLNDAERGGAVLPEPLRPALGRIYETLGGALHEMRELIGHLRPAQFEGRRLPEILADAITGFEVRSGSRVVASNTGEFPENGISITQRITFYRILQETLTNAHRHGRAEEVRVSLVETDKGITLEVEDDGIGFDPDNALRPRPGTPVQRFGLFGMRDRAHLLDGTFDVTSAPGQGTTVRVFLPRWRPPEAEAHADVG
jgi:signal transduction histidine kinase